MVIWTLRKVIVNQKITNVGEHIKMHTIHSVKHFKLIKYDIVIGVNKCVYDVLLSKMPEKYEKCLWVSSSMKWKSLPTPPSRRE